MKILIIQKLYQFEQKKKNKKKTNPETFLCLYLLFRCLRHCIDIIMLKESFMRFDKVQKGLKNKTPVLTLNIHIIQTTRLQTWQAHSPES